MKAIEHKPKSTLKPLYLFYPFAEAQTIFYVGRIIEAQTFARNNGITPEEFRRRFHHLRYPYDDLCGYRRPRVLRFPGWVPSNNHDTDRLVEALACHQAIIEDVRI